MNKSIWFACWIGLSILCLGSAKAQSSFGLGEINPWGKNYLQRAEPSLPTAAWQNSDAPLLENLLTNIQPQNMEPLQRALLRRLLLSPAVAPTGDPELIGKLLGLRAKLIFDLGEAEAAIDLLGRIKTLPNGLNPDELAADLKMALGQESDVCSPLLQSPKEGRFWVRTRVACAIMTGDASLAGLTLEFADMQGVRDPWLIRSVLYAQTPGDDPPLARFDSGVNLALSLYLQLPTPINAVSVRRKELAAILAVRESIESDLRVSAARIAFRADLITLSDFRTAYDAYVQDLVATRRQITLSELRRQQDVNGYSDSENPSQTAPQPNLAENRKILPRNGLDFALLTIADTELPLNQKLTAAKKALNDSADSIIAFKEAAHLIVPFLNSVPVMTLEPDQYIVFASAALAVENLNLFKRFLDAEARQRAAEIERMQVPIRTIVETQSATTQPGSASSATGTGLDTAPVIQTIVQTKLPEPDPALMAQLDKRAFAYARLNALAALRFQVNAAEQRRRADILAQSAQSADQKLQAGHVFMLWQISGFTVPASAVAWIKDAIDAPLNASDSFLFLQLRYAVERKAVAEATLSLVTLLQGRMREFHPLLISDAYVALMQANSADVARDLLLMASNYWKDIS